MSFFRKMFSGKDKESSQSEYLNQAYGSLGDEANLNPDKILEENSEASGFWKEHTPIPEHKDWSESVEKLMEMDTAEGSGGDFAVSEEDRAASEAIDEYTYDHAAEDETVTEYEPETEPTAEENITAEPEIIEEELPEREAEEADSEYNENETYGSLSTLDNNDFGGDTGEMDLGALSQAIVEANEYAAQLEGFKPGADEDENEVGTDYGREFFAEEKNGSSEVAGEPEGSASDNSDFQSSGSNSVNSMISHEDTSSSFGGEVDMETLYSAYAPKSMRPKVTETSYFDLDNIPESKPEEPKGFKAFVRKRRNWIIGAAAAVVVVAAVVTSVFLVQDRMNPLMGYTETYVTKGNIIKTMEAGGSVEPVSRYNIISLVGGTITESPLNAGEEVKAGELVYKVDDTNAQLAVQQAQNAVSRAQQNQSGSSSEQLRIYANASGVISGLNISSGSRITGGQIATITQANGTEIGLIPGVTGTVESVSVRNGATVTSGQVIATLKSETDTKARELDLAAANLALEQAQKELENYKIASPIDGVILVKNAKIGDSVLAGQGTEPLMVIADMSKMKFTIEVDELDIWNIELGQTVVITANALPGETFSGEITNIAGEGEKKGGGVTTYAVEITISDPGRIKSGMNVDAKIIINSAVNVLSLPESALYESDGSHALVITDSNADEKDIANNSDYPNITVPKGFKLVKVDYGVSDGTNVEIVSGLNIGAKVLYKSGEENSSASEPAETPQAAAQATDSAQTAVDAENPDDGSENLKSTGRSATQEELNDI